jgi:hypothetical protein
MRGGRFYNNITKFALLLVLVCVIVVYSSATELTHHSVAATPLTILFIIIFVGICAERGRIAQGLLSLSKKLDRRRALRSFQATRRRRQGMV